VRHAAFACIVCLGLVGGVARATGPPSGIVQARVLVNPLSVAVLVPPDPQKVGKDFRIRAEVTNAGPTSVQNVAVTLLAPQSLVLRAPATQSLPLVPPAATRGVRWDACTTTAGGYVVMARATAGPFTVESTGQLVRIASTNKPGSC
jgi:hypothetical protein